MPMKMTSHGGEFDLKLNGSKLEETLEQTVTSVEVERGIHLADRVEVVFADPRWVASRDKRIKHGDKLDVTVPYNGSPVTLISGCKVGRVDVASSKDEGHFVHVVAFGPRYTLNKGVQAQTFEKSAVGDSLKKMATSSGFSGKAGTSPQRTYLLQANVANRGMMEEFAARTGLVVLEEGQEINVSAPDLAPASLTLTFGMEVLRFRVEVNTMGVISELSGSSLDYMHKTAWKSKAKSCSLSTGTWSKFGDAVVKSAFSPPPSELTDLPVKGQSELEKMVQAVYDDKCFSFVTGEGLCWGAPPLTVGKLVTLERLGKKLSGAYYVTRVVHRIDRSAGFTTLFEVCRPALSA